MGVPIITMPGQHFFGRMSVSILNSIGCDGWIANTQADYVDLAARMAADVKQLVHERSTLRSRVRQSSLCDEADFTRGLEAAFRSMRDSAVV